MTKKCKDSRNYCYGFWYKLAEWGPPGPFSSPFGFEEVLELETLIFKLEKTIIAHFKDLDKPIKMASLNLKGYFLFWYQKDKHMDRHF